MNDSTKAGADLNGDGKIEVGELVKAVDAEIASHPHTVVARMIARVKGAVSKFARFLGL